MLRMRLSLDCGCVRVATEVGIDNRFTVKSAQVPRRSDHPSVCTFLLIPATRPSERLSAVSLISRAVTRAMGLGHADALQCIKHNVAWTWREGSNGEVKDCLSSWTREIDANLWKGISYGR